MSINPSVLALQIDMPMVDPSSENYRPESWPPPDDFPIVIDAKGNIISRYGDPVWNIWPWTNSISVINFCDGPAKRYNSPTLSKKNADLLRQIAAWWLYGPRAITSANSLIKRINVIRPVFLLCSKNGISVDQLSRFPAISDQLSATTSSSRAEAMLHILHSVYEQRDKIGYMILDQEGLRRLASNLPDHNTRQTPYIPPRIWKYQVKRLREFLEDFHTHREQIEACYHFCLSAYVQNYGSLEEVCTVLEKPRSTWSRPFQIGTPLKGRTTGAVFHGPFSDTAENFGIAELLKKWVSVDGDLDGAGKSVSLLSKYFSLTTFVGMAYIMNFSLMRVDEAWSLRSDCFSSEVDIEFGEIYMLTGETTKTIEDDDARWITSASSKLAVDAMAIVAKLRTICAVANPDLEVASEFENNPWLTTRSYEPWRGTHNANADMAVRPSYPSYASLVKIYPNLFDKHEITITDDDLNVAQAITPSLDISQFRVGNLWPFAWHQLRRTGAVNMQASDIVSDASLQYQLKHLTRTMSIYYGRGYSRIRLNQSACGEYIRTMYEVVANEMSKLFTDRFVSPYGDNRKQDILRMVDVTDVKSLNQAAKNGKLNWRETFFGICTKEGTCPHGGWDDVSQCGGQTQKSACVHGLIDRDKESRIRHLLNLIKERLNKALPTSPLYRSLNAQFSAIENTLHVINK
ncbi:hypothetical protein [Pseudomonas sp. ACN5]|uniref:hypothetical protein n=1 Tax=Pseudomonas sp. ACN5 TaxID=1920427 RepID=UPI0011426A81|nr:hypothetical protein [Pseudomonas sp. ACN5]PBJ09761.1 hypothetical protein BSF40_10180 [Pseudomonas sp. ACN5]